MKLLDLISFSYCKNSNILNIDINNLSYFRKYFKGLLPETNSLLLEEEIKTFRELFSYQEIKNINISSSDSSKVFIKLSDVAKLVNLDNCETLKLSYLCFNTDLDKVLYSVQNIKSLTLEDCQLEFMEDNPDYLAKTFPNLTNLILQGFKESISENAFSSSLEDLSIINWDSKDYSLLFLNNLKSLKKLLIEEWNESESELRLLNTSCDSLKKLTLRCCYFTSFSLSEILKCFTSLESLEANCLYRQTDADFIYPSLRDLNIVTASGLISESVIINSFPNLVTSKIQSW